MKKKIGFGFLLLSVMVILSACTTSEAVEGVPEEYVSVTVESPVVGDINITTSGVGTLEAAEIIWVNSSVGEIDQIFVSEGDVVTKEMVLFTIDSTVKVNNLDALESQLRTVRDTLKIQLDDLRDQLAKNQKLYESGAVAKATVDAIRASVSQVEKQYIDAANNYSNQVANLKEDLESNQIKSPINGVVSEITIEEGNLYSGVQAIEIISGDHPIVVLPVSLKQRQNINKETPVIITTESDETMMGVIDSIKQNVQNPNLYDITVEAKPEELTIYPGEFVDVTFITKTYQGMLIPNKALRRVGDETFVYLHNDGSVEKKVVEVGPVQDNLVEVLGLKTTDQVIVDGADYIKVGSEVSVFQYE